MRSQVHFTAHCNESQQMSCKLHAYGFRAEVEMYTNSHPKRYTSPTGNFPNVRFQLE
jgi:hypothetical protein